MAPRAYPALSHLATSYTSYTFYTFRTWGIMETEANFGLLKSDSNARSGAIGSILLMPSPAAREGMGKISPDQTVGRAGFLSLSILAKKSQPH